MRMPAPVAPVSGSAAGNPRPWPANEVRDGHDASSRRLAGTGARVLVALLLAALGAATESAADPAATEEPASAAVSLTPSLVSQYMFRGIHIEGPSFQPSVEVVAGNLVAGVWANFPVASAPAGDQTDEIDPYASYKIAVSGNASLLPGIQIYGYPHSDTGAGSYRATVEPYLGLTYVVGPLTFSPKIYYDVILDSETYELNAGYKVPLPAVHTELDFAATLGTDVTHHPTNTAASGLPQAETRNSYWMAALTVPISFVRVGNLSLGYAYMMGFSGSVRESGMARMTDPASMGRPVLSVIYEYGF